MSVEASDEVRNIYVKVNISDFNEWVRIANITIR